MSLYPKRRPINLLILLCAVFFFCSCKKESVEIAVQKEHTSVDEKRFFDERNAKNEIAIRIIKDLKHKNLSKSFVDKLIKAVGYPRWDHTFRTVGKLNFSANNSAVDSLYVIPMVDTGNNFITGAIVATLNDSINFRVIRLNDYNLQSSVAKKEYHVQYMIMLNYRVFGHHKFFIKDSSIFPGVKKIFLKKSILPAGTNTGNRSGAVCSQIVEIWWDPDGPDDPCDCSGNEFIVGYETEIWLCDENDESLPPSGGWNCPDPWGNCPDPWGGGGGGSPIVVVFVDELPLEYMISHLSLHLNTSLDQEAWMRENETRTKEMFEFLTPDNNPDDKEILKSHLKYLIEDTSYYNFVDNYRNESPQDLKMWWEDDDWLDDPDNFNLDIDKSQDDMYDKLTAAEKLLVKKYPGPAYRISKNVNVAYQMSTDRMGTGGGLNDKKDAFRHGFFSAINSRDCGKDPYTLQDIARQFSDAHESEVPIQLMKEKQMDLWNNAIGHLVGDVMFPIFISNTSIADDIMQKLQNGELIYLSPLNFVQSPLYDINKDGVQDCPTCLNGIISITVLKPTNQ